MLVSALIVWDEASKVAGFLLVEIRNEEFLFLHQSVSSILNACQWVFILRLDEGIVRFDTWLDLFWAVRVV